MGISKNKQKLSTILSLLILIGAGFICGYRGFHLIDMVFENSNRISSILFTVAWLILWLYLSMYIQIIIHEGGHFLFGKISGYKLVSFRIGQIMFINDKGRLRYKKFTVVGTGGQCLMMPPEGDAYDFPFILYNLGGSIANILVSVIFFILYRITPDPMLSLMFIIIAILGFLFALMNGIPMYLGGIANDGCNAVSLGKDRYARHAFWLQLSINALITEGTRMGDMPPEWFSLPPGADLNNPLICSIGVFRCSYLHDRKDFAEAKTACEFFLEKAPGILKVHQNELLCELLFYEIIGEGRRETIDSLYTKDLQKYIKATKSYVSRSRLLYGFELLINHNKKAAMKHLRVFEKALKTYPFAGEIASEWELIDIINEKARC